MDELTRQMDFSGDLSGEKGENSESIHNIFKQYLPFQTQSQKLIYIEQTLKKKTLSGFIRIIKTLVTITFQVDPPPLSRDLKIRLLI